MTVCITAISTFGKGFVIIGASDRMLTAADVEFEPEVAKIYPITNSIVALLAGDSPTQAEILRRLTPEISKQLDADPNDWLDIRAVAELYARCYKERRSREAETAILTPIGLDTDTFISRQRELEPSFIRMVATELYNYKPADVAAIITGMDDDGPHIFVVDNGSIDCYDSVGFASIGIGAGHANSQLMFAGHNAGRSFPQTLMQIYAAKKRAEVAPGVGESTDMFTVGPQLGNFHPVPSQVIARLEKTHQTMRQKIKEARSKAEGEISEYFKKTIEQAQRQSKQQSQPDSDGEASANSARVRADSEESERENGADSEETTH